MHQLINLLLWITPQGDTLQIEFPQTLVPTSPSEFVNRYDLPQSLRLRILQDGLESVLAFDPFADPDLRTISFTQALAYTKRKTKPR